MKADTHLLEIVQVITQISFGFVNQRPKCVILIGAVHNVK